MSRVELKHQDHQTFIGRQTMKTKFCAELRREESRSRRIEAPRPPNRQGITNNEDEVLRRRKPDVTATKSYARWYENHNCKCGTWQLYRSYFDHGKPLIQVSKFREIMKVDKSEDSLTPVKAFWYPFEFDNSCKACCPFIKLDKVFGEWTCEICLHQTYGERRIMKHVEDNHEQPLHNWGKSKELTQNSADFNNNETRVTEVEPMETESNGFVAGTESLEIQEAIDPIHG